MAPQHIWREIVVRGGASITDVDHGLVQALGPADLPVMGYHLREDETCWYFRWQGRLWRTQSVCVHLAEDEE
jgi:hypothetical protein